MPASEQHTAGYTLVNLSARYRLPLGPGDALLFVKLHNAGNQAATNASIASTASTVRPLSPLPGRALSAGVRFTYRRTCETMRSWPTPTTLPSTLKNLKRRQRAAEQAKGVVGVQGTAGAEPLALRHGDDVLTQRFDCRPCEMHVVGKMRKNELQPARCEAAAEPNPFYKARSARVS